MRFCGLEQYFLSRRWRAGAAVARRLQLLRGDDRQAREELQQVVGVQELAPRALEPRALTGIGAIVEAKHATHFLRIGVQLIQRILRDSKEQASARLGAESSDTHEPLRIRHREVGGEARLQV